jgi:hypothetical protein
MNRATNAATSTQDRVTDAGIPAEEDLVEEVITLRRLVAGLTEQREDDRRSILILQSQIDNLRDVKCTDSVESSFKAIGAVCSALWSRIPEFPIDGIVAFLRRNKRKKSGRISSKSSVSSRKNRSNKTDQGIGSKSSIETAFKLNRSIVRGT